MKKMAGFAVNGLVVVTCALTIVNIGKNWFSKPTPRRAALNRLPAGTKLDVPELDWTKAPATLVLVISPTCQFCQASVPFYRKMLASAASAGVGLVALSPTPLEETQKWLSSSGLAILEVRQLEAPSVFNNFPTVSLANTRGIVERSWVGSLTSDQQKEVIAAIFRVRKAAS